MSAHEPNHKISREVNTSTEVQAKNNKPGVITLLNVCTESVLDIAESSLKAAFSVLTVRYVFFPTKVVLHKDFHNYHFVCFDFVIHHLSHTHTHSFLKSKDS